LDHISKYFLFSRLVEAYAMTPKSDQNLDLVGRAPYEYSIKGRF